MRSCRRSRASSSQTSGQATPFWVAPPGLSAARGPGARDRRRATTVFPLMRSVGGGSEPVQGTSGVSAVYLNGVSQPAAGPFQAAYAPAITFATRARRWGRGHRRLRRLVALPLRRGRPGLRGVHGDALDAQDAAACRRCGRDPVSHAMRSEAEAIQAPQGVLCALDCFVPSLRCGVLAMTVGRR